MRQLFAAELSKEELERLDQTTLLGGKGSPEWQQAKGRATKRYQELVRRRQPSPRGGRRPILPRAEILLAEFDKLLVSVTKQWPELKGFNIRTQRCCVEDLFHEAGLVEPFDKESARLRAWAGSPARAPRSFTVRLLTGGYKSSQSMVNRLIRQASRES